MHPIVVIYSFILMFSCWSSASVANHTQGFHLCVGSVELTGLDTSILFPLSPEVNAESRSSQEISSKSSTEIILAERGSQSRWISTTGHCPDL